MNVVYGEAELTEEMQKSDAENRTSKLAPHASPPEPPTALSVNLSREAEESLAFEQVLDAPQARATDEHEKGRYVHIMEDTEADLSATSDDRLIALLCYWSQLVMPIVMPLIVLLSESGKRRHFQRHHAIQSLSLTGAIIGLSIVVTMGIGMLQIIPIFGFVIAMIALCLSPIAYFMIVIAYVFYGWQANKGKRFSIPLLSRFLRSQGWLD